MAALNLNQRLLPKHALTIEPRHDLLLAAVPWDAQFVEVGLGARLDGLLIQAERVRPGGERRLLAARENLVAAMFFIPPGQCRRHMHLLDNLAPADARVVSAERDLAFLSAVRDDAHLGAPKVVIEQVLKPHSRDKQEVPPVFASIEDVLEALVVSLKINAARYPAFSPAQFLVELLHEINKLKVARRLERVIVAKERERHPDDREDQPSAGVVYLRHVPGQLLCPEEGRQRRRFSCLLVHHHRHPDAAVRMAAASELSPPGVRAVNQVGPICES